MARAETAISREVARASRDMGVEPKIGGKLPPKWRVYNGKPYFLKDDIGGPTPIFGNTRMIH